MNVAVGATFETVTVASYVVTPLSLSRISPLTFLVPLSLDGQVAVLLELHALNGTIQPKCSAQFAE